MTAVLTYGDFLFKLSRSVLVFRTERRWPLTMYHQVGENLEEIQARRDVLV